jgi:hypothetical protein
MHTSALFCYEAAFSVFPAKIFGVQRPATLADYAIVGNVQGRSEGAAALASDAYVNVS